MNNYFTTEAQQSTQRKAFLGLQRRRRANHYKFFSVYSVPLW